MTNTIDIEGAIVASLLKKPELLTELRVNSSMFANMQYAAFISYVQEHAKVDLNDIYIKSAKDKTFVSNEKLSNLYNSEFIGIGYFQSLQDDIIHAFQKREAYRICSEFQRDETIAISDMLKQLQEVEILDFEQEESTRVYADELIDELYSNNPVSKIKTKFGLLDYKIGGFEPSQLVVIAARPSVGKTAFALNLLWNIATQGYQTTFFSIETTGKNILQRLLTSHCKIELTKIKEVAELSVEETGRLIKGLDAILHKDMNIVAKSNITVKDIRAQAMQQTDKPQVIFIDYLQLMQTDAKMDRRVAIERISRDLKIIANETGAVIIVLSQLNRGVEQRQDKRPMLSDMKESGGIEADASIAMLLYRDDYYNREQEAENGQSEIECNIAKNKDGETGVIKFDFYKKIQRFYS